MVTEITVIREAVTKNVEIKAEHCDASVYGLLSSIAVVEMAIVLTIFSVGAMATSGRCYSIRSGTASLKRVGIEYL